MEKLLVLLSAKSTLDDKIENLIFLQSHSLELFGPAVAWPPTLLRKFVSCAEHLLLMRSERSSFGSFTTRKGMTSLSKEELDVFQGQVRSKLHACLVAARMTVLLNKHTGDRDCCNCSNKY